MTTKQKRAIFAAALEQVGDIFTSNEVGAVAHTMGLTKKDTGSGALSEFFVSVGCKKISEQERGRTWVKPGAKPVAAKQMSLPIVSQTNGVKPKAVPDGDTIQWVIDHLKSIGWKVMRPTYAEV